MRPPCPIIAYCDQNRLGRSIGSGHHAPSAQIKKIRWRLLGVAPIRANSRVQGLAQFPIVSPGTDRHWMREQRAWHYFDTVLQLVTIVRVYFEMDLFFGEAARGGEINMLAFCTSPSQISLVLGPSDARWLSEEMAFLAELYRSKASSSGRQFGEDHNAALASFMETAVKRQQLSVALQQAVRRGYRAGDDAPPPGQHVGASQANDLPRPSFDFSQFRSLSQPSRTSDRDEARAASGYAARAENKKSSSTSGGRRSEGKGARAE